MAEDLTDKDETGKDETGEDTTGDKTKTAPVVIPVEVDDDWNIKFVGKERLTNGEWRLLDPPKGIIPNGSNPLKLPSPAKQLAGFNHNQAAIIARMYPDLYKLRRNIDEMEDGVPVTNKAPKKAAKVTK